MTDQLASHRARFEADPDATASFEWLEESYFLAGDWEPLAECYRHRQSAPSLESQPGARAQLNFRLGQLLADRLEDATGAILAFRECVSLDPTQRLAWERLRGLYASRGSWTAVLQVAELELAQTQGPAEQVALLDEIARIWDSELGDSEQAAIHHEQATSLRAQASLAAPENPAPSRPAPPESAKSPERAAEKTEPDDTSLVQQAWLAAARGDSTAAVAALRKAMEQDHSDIEAIDMLLTVLDGAERHAEMAELLERRAALAGEKETRAAVLARLGVVRETQLGDATGAVSAHERALTADASHVGSRAALMRLYRSTERWSELRTLLESSSSDGPADTRAALLCQLGALLSEQFDEQSDAIAAYEQALALDGEFEPARQGLQALREAIESEEFATEESATEDEDARSANENRSVRVVGVLERKLARIQDEGHDFDGPAIKLRLRIAELRSTTLGDIEGAIDMLTSCVHDPVSMLEVAQRLSFLYERAGRHPELIELARRAAELSLDAEERAGWYRRAAETARILGDGDSAVTYYHCLLSERPNDRNAESALLELHRARGEAAPLVSLLRSELARVSSREELPLQLELADLLEDALENPASALPHWRRALALDTSQVEALERALRCAGSDGGSIRQLDLLDYLTQNATDEGSRARLLARRGDLMVDSFGWQEEGAESWRRSLELEPNQPGVRSRLEESRTATG